MTDLDAIWTELTAELDPRGARPRFRFDPAFYAGRYADVAEAETDAETHFRTIGREMGRFPNHYSEVRANYPEVDARIAGLVTDARIKAAIAAGEPGALELAFELMDLGEDVDAEISNFSRRHYLRTYRDILRAGLNPLRHYLIHGFHEGRSTLAQVRERQRPGAQTFDPGRPTCLITAHELSKTGAPIVSVDLAREASRTHNVIFAALRDGPLSAAACEHACAVVISPHPHEDFPYFEGEIFEAIDFAVVNSVECFDFARLLVARDIPFAAYLHEYAYYTFPTYKRSRVALFADLVVFSSDHVRDSWRNLFADLEFDVERDSTIVPQRELTVGSVEAGRLAAARARLSRLIGRDCSTARIVCGAGHAQWRKGTDIFVMAAQICRHRDPETIFVWIGDGMNHEDINFGVWTSYQLKQAGTGDPRGNLFFLPAGDYYLDVLAASDAMFVSSRLDPLPNVVFDALKQGCRAVVFEGGTGFADPVYRASEHVTAVEYGNPEAAATALMALPRKVASDAPAPETRPLPVFAMIAERLHERLAGQRHFVLGESEIDVPMLFTTDEEDRPLRVKAREKFLSYRRRFIWRDRADAEEALAASENWSHRNCRIVPYDTTEAEELPPFSMHIHAFYTDELAADLRRYRAFRHADRIVVTTDSERKAETIHEIMAGAGLSAEVVLGDNRGRDILPFMELFRDGGAAGDDEIWCHLHQKKSLGVTNTGDIWRQFLMSILLGDDETVSSALRMIGTGGTGLVAPFDPYFVPWNDSRDLLPKFADRLPGPMPDNPLLFPVGNMFWVRREVVLAMNAIFEQDYPWPNEPIANDGTEFHLIERLWPAMATSCDLLSLFIDKPDQKRT
ncbi:rhamnan synthesis F family protein [Acidimangrovimonas pyrenivorans]|uniref:Rhamnan synthesis F family protein n=1 Tax=Acidimangrovimonas pyrenivorans TaxID=2030798 RepID=A0ABV7AMB0_9RHOB